VTYYARFHLLSTSRFLMSGMGDVAARLSHVKTATLGGGYVVSSSWEMLQPANPLDRLVGFRHYGSSVLAPGLEDVIIVIGGQHYDDTCKLVTGSTIHSSVQFCVGTADAATFKWSSAGSLNSARLCANAVILPDESLFYVGGTNVAWPMVQQ